jgi:hypothetical protein
MKPAKKGAIYLRENAWYKTENVVKMGITTLVKSRGGSYVTSEIERGEFTLIIEIPLNKLKTVDNLLKTHFKEHHVYKGGGTEFYNKCIYELVEPYIKSLDIEYKVISKEEIVGMMNKTKVTNPPINEVINISPIASNIQLTNEVLNRSNEVNKCNINSNDTSEYKVKHNDCICGVKYTNRSGLWKHKKRCVHIIKDNYVISDNAKQNERIVVEPIHEIIPADELYKNITPTDMVFLLAKMMNETNHLVVSSLKSMEETRSKRMDDFSNEFRETLELLKEQRKTTINQTT